MRQTVDSLRWTAGAGGAGSRPSGTTKDPRRSGCRGPRRAHGCARWSDATAWEPKTAFAALDATIEEAIAPSDEISGVFPAAAQDPIAEIGMDMSRFPSDARLQWK
jgi:hypothetical protein